MTRVLVTGGAGDIGYFLALAEADKGACVDIVENFSRGKRDQLFEELLNRPGVTLIEGDLCSREFVGSLKHDYDYVFHLAALNGTDNFYSRPFTVLENCTLPTVLLLEHFAKDAIKRFVYAGSSEAYASTVSRFGWPVPTDEDVPLCIENPKNPRWSYGASKLHGEIACFAAASQFGLPVTVIRFHNVYGPRMGKNHVIPDFIRRARNGVYELKGAEDTRSFIYVTDAVRACILAAESRAATGEIINIGGEKEIGIGALARLILDLMGKKDAAICELPGPAGSVPRRAPDNRKLSLITGFTPEVDLKDGLLDVIQRLE